MQYHPPLFRPPAESTSMIFQCTYGCSWNHCTFCEMYARKPFAVRNTADILAEIESCRTYVQGMRKIFLADGNAMVLPFDTLATILDTINRVFPRIQRVSAYALPGDILRKTPVELAQLRDRGLTLLYVGLESGDEAVLRAVNKSETPQSSLEGLLRAKNAGIDLSLMVLNGLGGTQLSRQHAVNSAAIVSAVNPKYLSTLVMSYPLGLNHFLRKHGVDFEPLSTRQLAEEIRLFVEELRLDGSIFRSDHVSNHLILKGVLNKDKDKIVARIDSVLNNYDIDKIPNIYEGMM